MIINTKKKSCLFCNLCNKYLWNCFYDFIKYNMTLICLGTIESLVTASHSHDVYFIEVI